MVFVAVSVTSMAGIPAQHAGMASGFLMTGHEVGAALGVAVLSAVATAAGSLTDAAGVVDGFTAAFLAAAVLRRRLRCRRLPADARRPDGRRRRDAHAPLARRRGQVPSPARPVTAPRPAARPNPLSNHRRRQTAPGQRSHRP